VRFATALAALALLLPAPAFAEKNSAAAYHMAADFGVIIGRCWFGKGEKFLAGYVHATESNAITGPPRVLLVDRKAPHGLPALVIEFKTAGRDIDIAVYGPLASGPKATRIGTDLNRWAAGGKACK
jgi:hypothetical protein